MRFAFRDVSVGGRPARPRPIVDVVVAGLDVAPWPCLLDSGATAVRMGLHAAELAAVDLTGAPTQRIAVAGNVVEGRMAEVSLEVSDGGDSYVWEAPVWFCDPWYPAFGLLGLTGFFDRFRVTMSAYHERLDLRPVSG